MGAFGTDSKSVTNTDASVNNAGASDYGVTTQSRGSGIAAGTGAIVVRGKNVRFTQTVADSGAFAQAAQVLGEAIHSQANLSQGAVKSLADLGQTTTTGGANLGQRTTVIAVVVIGALLAVALVVFRIRR